jgi:hypothetical protein
MALSLALAPPDSCSVFSACSNYSICLTAPVLPIMGLHMKTTLLPVALAGLLLAPGLPAASVPASPAAPDSPDLILRCHFSGLASLLADTNAARLKQIWGLPATADLKKQAFDQLARTPFQALRSQLGPGASDQAALFRPLLEDLLPGESFLEWRGPAGQATEFVLGLQLADSRARVWRDNLRQALEKWKIGAISEVKTGPGEGWLLKHRDGHSAFAWARAGQWVVIGFGPEGLPLHAQMLQRIKAGERPAPGLAGHWLVADANLERLKPWLPPLAPYAHPPLAHLTVSNLADYVRSTVQLQFPQGHGWKSEPWAIPTSLIRPPLVSFTAAQGLAPLLQPWKSLQQLGFDPPLHQVVLWANGSIPFLTQMAFPARLTDAQLARLAPLVRNAVASVPHLLPPGITWDTNSHSIMWRGLPIAVPQLKAAQTPEGEYLVGSLFPRLVTTNPAPPELFQQVQGRSDLLYYDWELTDQRVRQWRPLFQLLDAATGLASGSTNTPTQRWLMALAPTLGPSVTELTAASPTQLTLVRKSPCGLTSFEIVSFIRWLDSPAFPTLSLLGHDKPVPPVRQNKAKTR